MSVTIRVNSSRHIGRKDRWEGNVVSVPRTGRIAQLAEQLPLKESVGGSIPPALTNNMSAFNLNEHLVKDHKRTPFSKYLREITYGGNDGIVTTFAVVAGFAGAAADPASSTIPIITVLLFGLANLLADGLSMSLGSFLSLRADQDMYKKERQKEIQEIAETPDHEVEETIEILRQKGFSLPDAKVITRMYQKNHPYWIEFMMKDELEMSNPEQEHPTYVALSTFLSFVSFGSIPLIPYFLHLPGNSFPYSVMATIVALSLLGILRGSVSHEKPYQAVFETICVGGIAAASAYIVGSFFRI